MTNVAEKKKRRPAPATTAGDERSHLIDQWLGLYASDPDFQESIERFAVSQELVAEQIVGTYGEENATGHVSRSRLNAGMPAFAEYVGKVEGFAAQWHLHLLGERGYEAVHDYCLSRFEHGTQPEHFDATRASRLRFPRPILDPRLTLTFSGAWQPTREALRDAKARMLKDLTGLLEAELQRIAAEHERAGFGFQDTSPERRRHLRWTYWELVKGLTVAEIAAMESERADGGSFETSHFDNTIREMRAALGLPPRRRSTL